MKLKELRRIRKSYFGHEELAKALRITPASARVAAGRYVKQGLLVRVKRNMYMLRDVWDNADREVKFRVANIAQVPSYISLMTALDYYDITTQMQRGFFESVAIQRTKQFCVNNTVFKYTKIAEPLYFGYGKRKGFFIATPEKALLDAFYLMSYGRYALDLSALHAAKLDLPQLSSMAESFPPRTKTLLTAHGYLSAT